MVFEENQPFIPGKINIISEKGNNIALFGCGVLLPRLFEAAEILEKKGIGVTLVEVNTIKPIDVEGITSVLKKCGAVVTAEDHNIIGGLGSAIMEVAGENCPVPISRIGLRDTFSSSGLPDELLDYYKMSVNDIVKAAENTISRKK